MHLTTTHQKENRHPAKGSGKGRGDQMRNPLNNNLYKDQLAFGRLVERGTAADTGIDWAGIHPTLADPAKWRGASINSGAVAPAKALALIAAAERTAESNRGADVVAYQFPGCGWRWTHLTRNMHKVLRSIHTFEGITSDQIDDYHHGLDSRTRGSELRAAGFIIAGRRDVDLHRTRRYKLIGDLVIDYAQIVHMRLKPLTAAMPGYDAMLDAICATADSVAQRTKANAATRIAKLSKRTFMSAQLDMFDAEVM